MVEDELKEIQRKYRSFLNFIINDTGFINGIVLDMLWKSLLIKVDKILQSFKSHSDHQSSLSLSSKSKHSSQLHSIDTSWKLKEQSLI
jgi:hypothetical protein